MAEEGNEWKEKIEEVLEGLTVLGEEETFNLGFATPYKCMSLELSVYCKGVHDGSQAQLQHTKEEIEKVLK